jgi:hypothetical protein
MSISGTQMFISSVANAMPPDKAEGADDQVSSAMPAAKMI